ncbi:flagellar basal-body MS-ring/collar protein FliF [Cohnella sp. GCM10027633]|uniref:flagellar basal-body MS-ring/collar protein FliF n=1 Tax=unclassified Cohnella TaxID=2636738 RepID=UPI003628743E
MNEKWARVRERTLGFWNQYNKTQKWVLASTAVLLLFIIIFLTSYFTKTEYSIAYQNLDETDAAAIIQYLDGSGISYKLSPDGTSISVPSASVAKVKVDVGSQGLVQNGSVGFDELSQASSGIGSTDKEFEVKLRNALNGEIQQLLLSKQGVARVKAIVTLPEESVFLNESDREKAIASVVMTFKPGYRPKQEEVDSYFNLVKSAVPNLAIENITVSNSTGGDLSPSAQIGGSGAVGGDLFESQANIKTAFETDLKRNIQSFLSPIVGMDNIVVSVVSSLNFDKIQTQEQLVQPLPDNDNNGIKISEQTSSETYTGTDGQTGGVAGTGETDIANYPGGSSSGTTSSEKTSSTVNWEVNRITNNIDRGPYKVNDLTINVGVDSAVMDDAKRTEIQGALVRSVRVLLAESGLDLTDEQMADRVSVIAQAFEDGSAGASGGASNSGYLLAGIGLLALALLAGGGYVVYSRRKKAAREAAELAAMPRSELPTIDIDNVANESQVRKQLESLAKRKPDEFVNLLRTWLVDE